MKATTTLLLILCSILLFGNDTTNIFQTTKTTHSIQLNNAQITYEAEAGYMKWQNNEGKHKANFFFVAYTKKGEKNRPITFCFNGGPGSSSLWLHMGALGPQRVVMTDFGDAPAPPHTIVENQYSWLAYTDLVFIDPVNTGYSRSTEKDGEKSFFGYENDIKSVGEFIRLYITSNKRWGSKKYLAGESYGTTRAVGVCKYLMDKHGMHLNGITLISCALNFAAFREYYGNDIPYVTNLPVFASSAYYHQKIDTVKYNSLEKLLKETEHYALNGYCTILAKGDAITEDEKNKAANKLSELTGLPAQYYIENNLRVKAYRFRKTLLKENIIGRYDARMTLVDTDPANDYSPFDPSFTKIKGAFSSSVNDYIAKQLNYENYLPYEIIGNVRPWKYPNGYYLNVVEDLKEALIVNPDLKIWIASGYYDLATSYFGTKYSIDQAFIPKDLKKNITYTYYPAGHMMYLEKHSLVQFTTDAQAFYNLGK